MQCRIRSQIYIQIIQPIICKRGQVQMPWNNANKCKRHKRRNSENASPPPGWIFRLLVYNTKTLTSKYTEDQVCERRLVSFIRFYLHDGRKNYYIHVNDFATTLFFFPAPECKFRHTFRSVVKFLTLNTQMFHNAKFGLCFYHQTKFHMSSSSRS